MKKQATSDQGNQETERVEQLLRQALRPIGDAPESPRDLWPAMLRKLDERPAAIPWFDWALIGGLAVMLAIFPAWIPVLLYYL